MYFFAALKIALQDILEQVGQEATLKDAEKNAKKEYLEFWDKLICQFLTKNLKIGKWQK
jgi:hypothetical protein